MKDVMVILLLILLSVSNAFSQNEELITNNEKGQKVNFKLRPQVGDILIYKMVAKTISDEQSPATDDQLLHTEQIMIYYYTQEVSDISESGVVTFEMKYDSINIISQASSNDTTLMEVYNSNLEDSVHALPDFIQYNALIGEYFKIRVSELGEVYDVCKLENIHKKNFHALGDTLTTQEKASIKESIGTETIKSIIQNQYQKFPEHEVYVDSSWSFTNETDLLVFPIKNLLSYKLSELKIENGEYIGEIDAKLGIEFISKKVETEDGFIIKLFYSNAGGKGTVFYNLTRGCISKKMTRTNIELNMNLSVEDESANSFQKLSTTFAVELF